MSFFCQYFNFDWSCWEFGGEVIQEIRQVAGFSVDDSHDIMSCLENRVSRSIQIISIIWILEKIHTAAASVSVPYLRRVLAERQGDKLLGKSLLLSHRQGGELWGVGMSHKCPPVRLVLYVDVRSKLQTGHTGVGALRLLSGQPRERCLDGGRWVAGRVLKRVA